MARLQKTFISVAAHKRNVRRNAQPVAHVAKPLRRIGRWLFDAASVAYRGDSNKVREAVALRFAPILAEAQRGDGLFITLLARKLNA